MPFSLVTILPFWVSDLCRRHKRSDGVHHDLTSVLIAGGDLSGYLTLEHAPEELDKRFQLGEGANNHNCNNGFGGWFSWSGEINGVEYSSPSGDIVVDLGECSGNDNECTNSFHSTSERSTKIAAV